MKRLLAILFTIVIFITGAININACWCRKDPEDTNTEERFRQTITRYIDNSDFVFTGKVIREDNEHITFKIADMWKGDASSEITFYSLHYVNDAPSPSIFIDSCEYFFEMDKSYLVYANVGNNGLTVSKCGRTSFLDAAARDITELNRQNRQAISAKVDYKLLSALILPQ